MKKLTGTYEDIFKVGFAGIFVLSINCSNIVRILYGYTTNIGYRCLFLLGEIFGPGSSPGSSPTG